jgi:BirA family biotin operon repressor/biotin-[acetyl-CoA-carboxylase] ligase
MTHSTRVIEAAYRNDLVREVCWRDEVSSTNSLALELVAGKGAALPLVVTADRQSAGRGRLGRSWFADEGGLAVSLVLGKEHLPTDLRTWSMMALATGICVAETIEAFIGPLPVSLKWPNDVYIAEKKVSGILLEGGPQLSAIVIGVGINVNTNFANAPEDVRCRAASISEALSHPLDRWNVLEILLQRFAQWVPLWKSNPRCFIESYRSRCLLTSRKIVVQHGDRSVNGVCRGISGDGALMITKNHEQHEFFSGEVLQW